MPIPGARPLATTFYVVPLELACVHDDCMKCKKIRIKEASDRHTELKAILLRFYVAGSKDAL